MKCPDGGTCHHSCEFVCWRVNTCLPLTASGWDTWPAEIKKLHPPTPDQSFESSLLFMFAQIRTWFEIYSDGGHTEVSSGMDTIEDAIKFAIPRWMFDVGPDEGEWGELAYELVTAALGSHYPASGTLHRK